MKKLLTILALLIMTLSTWAQTTDKPFSGRLENKELEVALVIDLYQQQLRVPQQEDIFGPVAGYFYYKHDGRKWIIVSCELQGDQALLTIINDYGSEDLTATLSLQPDGSFVLKQESGSTLKIVKNRKWVKIPKRITLTNYALRIK